MDVMLLEQDGRCRWLENKILNKLYPRVMKNARDPSAQKQYIIVDWISNDDGRVGVDLTWFKTLGVPAVQSYGDLPAGGAFKVINTGYDSIVSEEKALRDRGVEIIDEPCPFIRRLRNLLEDADPEYQYVLLCEANHIVVKNFKTIFPADMILVQMDNYRQRIVERNNNKPMRLMPYVTFLPSHADEILAFVREQFPGLAHDKLVTQCLWVKSKASPIVEINALPKRQLTQLDAALLITGSATTNKSVVSLVESLEQRGLEVTAVSSIKEYLAYEKAHPEHKVLLVRSPIPNNTEADIMGYVKAGYRGLLAARIRQNRLLRGYGIGLYNRLGYGCNWLKQRWDTFVVHRSTESQ
ncbi:MAG: LytB [Candidatus Thiodiazotropha sp. (ex Epidulcina cf. delphinae)]|nr:LytB [Candidatus Thiodiazotropha sp. (ex Epidulcina cf. delphinae)]